MTPLEELQAAHKRLSVLRTIATSAPWTIGAGSSAGVEIDGWTEGIVHARVTNDADLIVTLHRTIDAQLAILNQGIAHANGAQPMMSTLRLARSINGGKDDGS